MSSTATAESTGHHVIAHPILGRAWKAAALVVLLMLAWAAPVQAHAGHGARTAVAAAAKPAAAAQPELAAARPTEAAAQCRELPSAAPEAPRAPQGEGLHGQACCGTVCTSALILREIASLPPRTAHRIRLGLPAQTGAAPATPGPHARPPRTTDIA